MHRDSTSWDARILRVVLVSQWLALALGVVVGVVQEGASGQSLVAAGIGSLFVIATTAAPPGVLRRGFVLDVVSLAGAVLTLTAVTLTGTTESPYFLLSVMPPVLATLLGGFRLGVMTAGLSAGLLMSVTLAQSREFWAVALGLGLLYVVIAITVAQVRKIMLDVEARASVLEASTAESARRIDQLEAEHDLLTQLAEIVADSRTGPTAVGRAALESVMKSHPDSAGVALLIGDEGPVVVARHGTEPTTSIRTRVPLTVGDREVGLVVLSTTYPLTAEQRDTAKSMLQPVALSFSNLLLLQDIARDAVTEERARLARELHDEIGPSLASLGLGIDVALLEAAGDRTLAEHLSHLRNNVSSLVEDVRSTVADLRAERTGSLISFLAPVVASLGPAPRVVVEIDERRPPRPSLVPEIAGILSEAVRNAHQHADATSIRVHGWVNFDRGRLVVEDDGSGFDPAAPYPGHFGLVGMRERAERVGGRLSIARLQRGTRVSLEWGES